MGRMLGLAKPLRCMFFAPRETSRFEYRLHCELLVRGGYKPFRDYKVQSAWFWIFFTEPRQERG